MTNEKTAYDFLKENDVRENLENSKYGTLEYELDNLRHWTDSLAYWKESFIEHYYKKFDYIENETLDEYETEFEHLLSRYKNASEMIVQSENTIKNILQYAKEGLYND